MSVRGLIFDMDGVLCDSEPWIAQAGIELFARHYDTQVTAADFEPFVGTGEDRYIGGVAEKYGITLDMPRDKDRLYEIYLALIPGKLTQVPGASQFITGCLACGKRIAVATSADRIKLDGNLQAIGLPPERFHAVITGSDVDKKKPAPDIFLAAAKQLQLNPDQCLVIEDAPAGVEAAKNAGSRCLGITSTFSEQSLRDAGADWIAKDLAAVPEEAVTW